MSLYFSGAYKYFQPLGLLLKCFPLLLLTLNRQRKTISNQRVSYYNTVIHADSETEKKEQLSN